MLFAVLFGLLKVLFILSSISFCFLILARWNVPYRNQIITIKQSIVDTIY